jgi:hypothetical protein
MQVPLLQRLQAGFDRILASNTVAVLFDVTDVVLYFVDIYTDIRVCVVRWLRHI